MNENVNRYYNRISGEILTYPNINTFDRGKGVISTSTDDFPTIYELKLKVFNLGTSNIIGDIVNQGNYTCNYEVAPYITTTDVCKCPSGTKNYDKILPFSCSDKSCADLQATYCDSDITIPVCENTCIGDCKWENEAVATDRLNIKYKYCDGNLTFCDVNFFCPNDKILTGDPKICVINKLRNYGYMPDNNLAKNINSIDRANLYKVLRECEPAICSTNYNSSIVFRTIDLDNPFPGILQTNGKTNKFSNIKKLHNFYKKF